VVAEAARQPAPTRAVIVRRKDLRMMFFLLGYGLNRTLTYYDDIASIAGVLG
jgi:hypothetical protein